MKSLTYWYQFVMRCKELVPILHGEKFTKCEIYGSTMPESFFVYDLDSQNLTPGIFSERFFCQKLN